MSGKGEIKLFPSGKVDADAVLAVAKKWKLKDVLILGWDSNDNFVWGGSDGQAAEIFLLLKHAENCAFSLLDDD